MKKIGLLFLVGLFFFYGCRKVEKIAEPEKKLEEEIVETVPEYKDENKTPIAFYQLKGNRLEKIATVTGSFSALDDIGLFQIYPSREDTIFLNTSFASSFYNSFHGYQNGTNLKIGFSLKFSISSGEEIFYNILNPTQTMDHWEYFMAYLYDDYANQGKSFYSHMESDEYTDSTLFTAFKLQCGANCLDISSSSVLLTVFTYDSEDDFLGGIYRGDSQYTISICMHGSC